MGLTSYPDHIEKAVLTNERVLFAGWHGGVYEIDLSGEHEKEIKLPQGDTVVAFGKKDETIFCAGMDYDDSLEIPRVYCINNGGDK